MSKSFNFTKLHNGILLSIQNLCEPYNNLFALKISPDKSASFFGINGPLDSKLFKGCFTRPYFITSLYIFKYLLEFIEINVKENYEIFYEMQDDKSFKNFINEQLLLSKKQPKGRRYSSETIIFSFMVHLKSAAAYRTLQDFLYLPDEKTLRNYSSSVGDSTLNFDKNVEFLRKQYSLLESYGKTVCLKFDEVSIKRKLDFRKNIMTGFAENREGELATHVQAFMILSVQSNFKQVVRLIPVHKQNTDFLYENTKDIIVTLEKIGFTIILLTADNHVTNRKCFKKFLEWS